MKKPKPEEPVPEEQIILPSLPAEENEDLKTVFGDDDSPTRQKLINIMGQTNMTFNINQSDQNLQNSDSNEPETFYMKPT